MFAVQLITVQQATDTLGVFTSFITDNISAVLPVLAGIAAIFFAYSVIRDAFFDPTGSSFLGRRANDVRNKFYKD